MATSQRAGPRPIETLALPGQRSRAARARHRDPSRVLTTVWAAARSLPQPNESESARARPLAPAVAQQPYWAIAVTGGRSPQAPANRPRGASGARPRPVRRSQITPAAAGLPLEGDAVPCRGRRHRRDQKLGSAPSAFFTAVVVAARVAFVSATRRTSWCLVRTVTMYSASCGSPP